MVEANYPIGHYQYDGQITASIIDKWINDIEELPVLLQNAVKDLNDNQLDTPYRMGGWTIRQVVHHVADSHLNAYGRFKLALTEDQPIIKSYDQEKWAELPDSTLPVTISLSLLDALHKRWVTLLRSLTPSELEKTFIHPESGEVSVGKNIGIYAWHGRHHLAHITSLRSRKGW
ncbi:YfiT family bacillithiol transferase [Neobacillus drentensis]|uniref:YfiT family bacillithiol transferase n=1 Tax=Neobacillus drentensis TaxID=220684 RepID=UPI002FFD9092